MEVKVEVKGVVKEKVRPKLNPEVNQKQNRLEVEEAKEIRGDNKSMHHISFHVH